VPVITYIDSGVLITAARGASLLSDRAISFLGDPLRTYVTSVFVRLEVLPKSIYHQNAAETEFYEAFFGSTQEVADIGQVLLLAFTVRPGGSNRTKRPTTEPLTAVMVGNEQSRSKSPFRAFV
jgi:hypothetical protein